MIDITVDHAKIDHKQHNKHIELMLIVEVCIERLESARPFWDQPMHSQGIDKCRLDGEAWHEEMLSCSQTERFQGREWLPRQGECVYWPFLQLAHKSHQIDWVFG